MRVLLRTSRLAIWARRLALFSLFLLLAAAGLRLSGQIDYAAFEISLFIGTVGAALGILLGVAAYIGLWFSGDRGWGHASAGVLAGLIGIAPVGLATILAGTYPSTVEVTTALGDPPPLQAAGSAPSGLDPETILGSYPGLITRIYQVSPQILFGLIEHLVGENGWTVIGATAPGTGTAGGQLNAIRPGILGWDNEMAFRVVPGPIGGAVIDLRAAALEPVRHDLGENGRAIEAFLDALDASVIAYIAANQPSAPPEETFEVIDDGDLPAEPEPLTP